MRRCGGCQSHVLWLAEHLRFREVLSALRSLCSSQSHAQARASGTDLGDRLRVLGNRLYRAEATKKVICWLFAKPSNGLEPLTPPYHGGFVARRRVGGGALPASFCLDLCALAVLFDPGLGRSWVSLGLLEPVPKTCPQNVVSVGYVARREQVPASLFGVVACQGCVRRRAVQARRGGGHRLRTRRHIGSRR